MSTSDPLSQAPASGGALDQLAGGFRAAAGAAGEPVLLGRSRDRGWMRQRVRGLATRAARGRPDGGALRCAGARSECARRGRGRCVTRQRAARPSRASSRHRRSATGPCPRRAICAPLRRCSPRSLGTSPLALASHPSRRSKTRRTSSGSPGVPGSPSSASALGAPTRRSAAGRWSQRGLTRPCPAPGRRACRAGPGPRRCIRRSYRRGSAQLRRVLARASRTGFVRASRTGFVRASRTGFVRRDARVRQGERTGFATAMRRASSERAARVSSERCARPRPSEPHGFGQSDLAGLQPSPRTPAVVGSPSVVGSPVAHGTPTGRVCPRTRRGARGQLAATAPAQRSLLGPAGPRSSRRTGSAVLAAAGEPRSRGRLRVPAGLPTGLPAGLALRAAAGPGPDRSRWVTLRRRPRPRRRQHALRRTSRPAPRRSIACSMRTPSSATFRS